MIVDKYGKYVRKSMWQLCGWGRFDICMTFHKRTFDFFISLHSDLTIFEILPHKFSYIVAILIHNHFESPNICEVIILCVVFTTQDFRIKEKNGANLFISSKHFIRAFFILASSKLRCFVFESCLKNNYTYVLPTLVITIANLEIFLFCQINSTGVGNLELRQSIGNIST
jgi:hypothetical protein